MSPAPAFGGTDAAACDVAIAVVWMLDAEGLIAHEDVSYDIRSLIACGWAG